MARLTTSDDLYAVMGVNYTASPDEIKAAYRKLAHQHHPDRNPGDSEAEERFKQLQQAYSILSDPSRRRAYDQLRRSIQPDPSPVFVDDFFSSIGEFFEELFGGRSNVVNISLERAIRGGPVIIRGKDGSLTRIVLPPGVKNKFRVRASDDPNERIFTFKILPHSVFTRKGANLHMHLSLNGLEALVGSSKTFTDLYGEPLTIEIPPNSTHGTKLRYKGRGVQSETRKTGDLLVNLHITPLNSLEIKILQGAAHAAGLMEG
ncbi:MAG: DnaJ domain-containing protein [Bacteroidetes bacterium]|nr:DnaJ domain-containing protein [Bacteroidota bacterium]MCY4225454.1 DnaJ domain-containing protein [Bacteroidota bacterium]